MYLFCDPALDSLLHLHKRKVHTAPRGANGNPAVGSAGPKRNELMRKAVTPPLLVPVPPGTVVKRKGSGAVRARGGRAGCLGARRHHRSLCAQGKRRTRGPNL